MAFLFSCFFSAAVGSPIYFISQRDSDRKVPIFFITLMPLSSPLPSFGYSGSEPAPSLAFLGDLLFFLCALVYANVNAAVLNTFSSFCRPCTSNCGYYLFTRLFFSLRVLGELDLTRGLICFWY